MGNIKEHEEVRNALSTDIQDKAAAIAAQIEETRTMIEAHATTFKQHQDAILALDKNIHSRFETMAAAVGTASSDLDAQKVSADELKDNILSFAKRQQADLDRARMEMQSAAGHIRK